MVEANSERFENSSLLFEVALKESGKKESATNYTKL